MGSWLRGVLDRIKRTGKPPVLSASDAPKATRWNASVAGLVEETVQPQAEFRMILMSLMAAVIGVASGFIAYLLYRLIGLFTNVAFFQRLGFSLADPWRSSMGPWVILVPIVGGLIVGVMAKYGSAKIKGHGIPEAMEAVLINHSRIEPKVAILKPISAAIAIGTGGPFGAEGPIIQTGGAIGSVVGQVLRTTAAERKVLLACGAGAGMSATFNTPIAGVILAIELLLFEFRARSFIPLVIASTLATTVHFAMMGRGPMFSVGAMNFDIPRALPEYVALGVLCGLAAVIFTKGLYWFEDQFEKLPVSDVWWPAIGAAALGVIGFFLPRVFGVGYDTISDILSSRLSVELLLLIMVFKSLALMISLGSGTSGGLLAPMFMASAAMGGAFATGLNHWFGLRLMPGAFALVAMGAVFGAASRAAFTFIIFAFEVTRDYNSVLPLMLVCVIADAVAMLFSPASIMTEKLERRGLRILQDYEPDVMKQVNVGEVMSKEFSTVRATMKVSDLADSLARGDPTYGHHHAYPIVDNRDRLVGIITHGDVVRAMEPDNRRRVTVLQAGTRNPVVAYPDELLYTAVVRMLQKNLGRMPVVSREDPRKVVGYLGRRQVMEARLFRLRDEYHRDLGWFGRRHDPGGKGPDAA